MRGLFAITWVVCVSACLQSPLVPCGDTVCPPGNVCTTGGCATPADVSACDGLADGEGCRAANGGAGTCQGGACRTGLCGNGAVDIGEVCDDANLVSGDGCRADCQKIEICGDGELDANEACDDGNTNAADGCDMCALTSWTATPVVGAAINATTIALANPTGVAVDTRGRIFVADTNYHRVRRIDLDGSITTIAGTGEADYSGDGGPATGAQLNEPAAVAVDGIGRVYIADTTNHRIRRINLDGTIVTIAGTGTAGSSGDGGPAILARVDNPRGVFVDGLGRVLVSDTDSHRIRRIELDGTIETIAGTGAAGNSGDGGAATAAQLDSPFGVTTDAMGRVLITDAFNHRIRRIELDGTIVTVAGTGGFGFGGDGGAATSATLALPASVSVDPMGRIVFSDALNERVRRIDTSGTITTVAGTGTHGYGGDGGPATAAQLALPFGIATDAQGRVVIADRGNQRIRRIATAGTITTIAGTGTFGFGGDGREATGSLLANPWSLTVDGQGRLFIADTFHHSIRRVDADGTIRTIAGTGLSGYGGDGGPATAARLTNPNAVAVDVQGNVYISDTFNQRIRKIDASGVITTIAGTGVPGFSGDGGAATAARIQNPNQLQVDAQGRVTFADTYNNRIRRIEANGTIVTLAGTGLSGFDGDGGPAVSARMSFPYGVVVHGDVIYASDTGNQRLRRIGANGVITTIAGTGTSGFNGDDRLATTAMLDTPHHIEVDSQDRVVFLDAYNHRVRRIEPDGMITTLVGSGIEGASGDAGPATSARIAFALGLALDAQDRIYIADTNNARVRRVDGGTITTVAGKIDPENVGPVATARLDDPQGLAVMPQLTLVAAGASGTLEAVRGSRVEVVAGRYPQELATGVLARFRTAAFGSVGGAAYDPTTGLVYIAETSANRLHVITPVDPLNPRTWTIVAYANPSGAEGFSDGAAATARFRSPTGLYIDDAARALYVADTGNHAVRKIDFATNTVTTVANTSNTFGFGGDDGPATGALLYRPTAITRCDNGDLFIADTGNNRVRRIVAAGTITTVLGDGVPASSGEGAPARTFPVDGPRGLACDALGNLYVTSTTTVRLLTATDAGVVDGSGLVQTIYGAPPRDVFPASVTSCLTGIVVTSPTAIRVADACTGLLVELGRAPI